MYNPSDGTDVNNAFPTQTSVSGRVLIENLDSVQQRILWNDILRQDAESSKQSTIWDRHKGENVRTIIHNHPQLTHTFSGILRTAFLYCPQILLTDAELLDGIFLLAFGPDIINEILGKTTTDKPSIIISGRGNSLDDCLKAFTLSTVKDTKIIWKKQADVSRDVANTMPHCLGDDNQYTLRPVELSSIGNTVTADQALKFSRQFYDELTERVNNAEREGKSIAFTVAWAYQQLWGHPTDEQVSDSTVSQQQRDFDFSLLAQRWEEWSDAIAAGRVAFENQNTPEIYTQIISRRYANRKYLSKDNFYSLWKNDFQCLFSWFADNNYRRIDNFFGNKLSARKQSDSIIKEFSRVITSIVHQPMVKRSDAFLAIDSSSLKNTNADQPLLCKQGLRDWYQFVYQRTLAEHLGAVLIAVNASENSFEQIAANTMPNSSTKHPTLDRLRAFIDRHLISRKNSEEESSHHNGSLQLDEKVTTVLGEMPSHIFAQFCYTTRTIIAHWRECDATASLHTVRNCTEDMAYSVYKASEEQSKEQERSSLVKSFLFATSLSLFAVLCDKVWLTDNVSLPAVVIISWLVSIIPNILEAIRWGYGVHEGVRTVIYTDRPDAVTTDSTRGYQEIINTAIHQRTINNDKC